VVKQQVSIRERVGYLLRFYPVDMARTITGGSQISKMAGFDFENQLPVF
jgi:hypothetical protein